MSDLPQGGDTPDVKGILDKLTGQQESMMNVVANIGQALQNLTGTMTSMQEAFKGGLNVNPPKDKEPEIDLSTADMPTMANFILKEVGKMVESVKGDFSNQINDIRIGNARSERTSEFKEVAGKKGNEDINEWLPEMRELATKNPNLGIQQLLELARLEDTGKHETIKAKRVEEEKKANPSSDEEVFGGLTPTSGRSSFEPKNGTDKKKVSLEQALNDSWNKVVPNNIKQEASTHDPLF